METNAILTPDPTKLSSTTPRILPKNSLEPGKPGSVLPDARVSRSPVRTRGGDAAENEVKTGEPLPDGDGSPTSSAATEVYRLPPATSTQLDGGMTW